MKKTLLTVLLLSITSFAALRVWNSSGSTDVNDGDNYDPTGVIAVTDSLVFKNTSVVDAIQTANLHVKALMILSTYTGKFFQDSMYTDTVDGTIYFGSGTNGTVRVYGNWIQTTDASIIFANNAGRIIMGKRVYVQPHWPPNETYEKYTGGANFDLRGNDTIYFDKQCDGISAAEKHLDSTKWIGFKNLTGGYPNKKLSIICNASTGSGKTVPFVYGKIKSMGGIIEVPYNDIFELQSFVYAPITDTAFDFTSGQFNLGFFRFVYIWGTFNKNQYFIFPDTLRLDKVADLYGYKNLTYSGLFNYIPHEQSEVDGDTIVLNYNKLILPGYSNFYIAPYSTSYNKVYTTIHNLTNGIETQYFNIDYDSSVRSNKTIINFGGSFNKVNRLFTYQASCKKAITINWDSSTWLITGDLNLKPVASSPSRDGYSMTTKKAKLIFATDTIMTMTCDDPTIPCSLFTYRHWLPEIVDSGGQHVLYLGDSLCDSSNVKIRAKFNQLGNIIRTFKNYYLSNQVSDTVWRKGTTYVGGDLFRNPGTVLFDTSEYILMNNGGGYSHSISGTGTIPHLTIRDNRSKVSTISSALSFGIIRQDSGTLKISGVTTVDTLYVNDSICGGDSIKVNKKMIFYPGNKSALSNTTLLGGTGGDTCKATLNNLIYNSSGPWALPSLYLYGNYSAKTGTAKPKWVGYPTILGNYDSTNTANNRPETSVVISVAVKNCSFYGNVKDTITVSHAGAAKGLYGKIIIDTVSIIPSSWIRINGDTVKIVYIIPAYSTKKVARRFYDQYGGSAVIDSLQYSSSYKPFFFFRR